MTINYCKRSTRLERQSLDAEKDEGYLQAKEQLKNILADERLPDPAAVAADKELCELIMRALRKLDDQQRAVVILRDIEGMNYAQIAEVLNTELGTVKSRLSRARNNLKEIMESILQ